MQEMLPSPVRRKAVFFNVDFSLFRPLEFFVDPKNGDGRNNNPPAMRVRVDCYTKKLPFLSAIQPEQLYCKRKGDFLYNNRRAPA